ncbi:MAG: aminodeoxychorismate synthase component I [Deltaproteobacteria bacterium]|nr:aminodeoxychorismate synthase component I [Deltaproteobacteria bacterium]
MNKIVIQDASADRWLYFREPVQVIETQRTEEVTLKLCEVEALVQEHGLHAAGFISYEAGPAFDSALQVQPLDIFPLLWFGLYPRNQVVQSPPSPIGQDYSLGHWTPSVSRAEYDEAIRQIKDHIRQGETYQVNYTLRLHAPFSGNPWALFHELVQAQQADYAAYVDTGRFVICSASPELFFRLNGGQLISRPMKGTAARGCTLIEDNGQKQWLHHSEKNRAENVMIVDMVRNDMGRVATVGSVQVPSLFDVERYPTLWQMTSTVTAKTDVSLGDIMTALFPCASITGAPKPSTMQIIANLETMPRRVYTGCIGFISPDTRAQFNVAIRTVLIDKETGEAEYGVGGGIVWDSVIGDEYEECQVKARVLTERRPDFSLLETLLWTPEEGYFLLEYHLQRLRDSAVYFDFPENVDKVREKLMTLATSLPKKPHKVRLLVTQDGAISCQKTLLAGTNEPQPVRLGLAPTPVDSASPFLYHKTTHRQVYDTARSGCPDCDDVLLWNEQSEITETCIANVVVELDGELVTPPVRCGLLPGTFRAWLLDQRMVREKVVPLKELKGSKRIYLVNSVRKWRDAIPSF